MTIQKELLPEITFKRLQESLQIAASPRLLHSTVPHGAPFHQPGCI